MKPTNYQPEAFFDRVNYARQCLLRGETDSREFDGCFEMSDGDLVFIELLKISKSDSDLTRALEIYPLEELESQYLPALQEASQQQIEALAEQLRNRFEGDIRRLFIELRLDPNRPD